MLADVIRRNVWAKWEGHEINTARFVKPQRTMHAIGGYAVRFGLGGIGLVAQASRLCRGCTGETPVPPTQ